MTTEAQKRASRKYYLANRERIIARVEKWRKALTTTEEGRAKLKRKRVAYRLKHPERWAAERARHRAKHPEATEQRGRRSRVKRQFASVVDVEVRNALISTKLVQLEIKKLLRHGEIDEERS